MRGEYFCSRLEGGWSSNICRLLWHKVLGYLITSHQSSFGEAIYKKQHFSPVPQTTLIFFILVFSSFQSLSMSNCLWPHGLQHARPPCPSPIAWVYSNSCPLSWWGHETKSSSVVPFSRLQSFPAAGSFSNESVLCIRWPKYWSFSFSISHSNEYSGLISFRMDCLDLFAVQGTLKNLLQHHDSKVSVLWHSAFFTVQLSHPYMTTGNTIALTRQTFVGKVMSLLFNMLSRLVITFLPRNKCLLISWLQSPSAVILEPPKIKSVTVSTVCNESMGPDAMILVFWMLSSVVLVHDLANHHYYFPNPCFRAWEIRRKKRQEGPLAEKPI